MTSSASHGVTLPPRARPTNTVRPKRSCGIPGAASPVLLTRENCQKHNVVAPALPLHFCNITILVSFGRIGPARKRRRSAFQQANPDIPWPDEELHDEIFNSSDDGDGDSDGGGAGAAAVESESERSSSEGGSPSSEGGSPSEGEDD